MWWTIPSKQEYPMPKDAHNRDEVFVGRLRRDETQPNTLNMWIVSDNLRKGAATNAVQIAEYLVEKGLGLIVNCQLLIVNRIES